MNKKLIIILIILAIIILVVIIGLQIFAMYQKKEITPKTKESEEFIDRNQIKNNYSEREEKVFVVNDIVTTPSGKFNLAEVYKNEIKTYSLGDIVFKENEKYIMIYSPEDISFFISIKDSNFVASRLEAENELLKFLKIDQEIACEINVTIGTTFDVNPTYSGKIYSLSFCPNE
jgi:hypothetical protein